MDKSHLNRTIKSNGPTFCPFGIILSRHSVGSIILSTSQILLIIFLKLPTLTGNLDYWTQLKLSAVNSIIPI